MSLNYFKSGNTLTIQSLSGDRSQQERLRELGFLIGREVTVIASSFLGGPIVLQVGGTKVALRQEELQCLKF